MAGLRCRLLFLEVRAGRLVVDAVVSSGEPRRRVPAPSAAVVGSPLTIVAELPTRPWGFAAKATLERWIEEGREVELRLRRLRLRGYQVEAATDEASMLLDLAA